MAAALRDAGLRIGHRGVAQAWHSQVQSQTSGERGQPDQGRLAGGQVVMPGWADELTPAQRAALEPARFSDKAIIEPDGSVSRPWEEYDEPPGS